MAYRTATYKSIDLGNFLVPVQPGVLDIATSFKQPHATKFLFEELAPSVRPLGNNLQEVTILFCKTPRIDSGVDTHEERRIWLANLWDSLRDTPGSEVGGTLVITDGSDTESETAYLQGMDIVENNNAHMIASATFLIKRS